MSNRKDIRFIESFFESSDLDKTIWRYMDLEKFESTLKNSQLYFASAEQFNENDNHEGAITEVEFNERKESFKRMSYTERELQKCLDSLESSFKPLREYAKISCWHVNDYENIAMWHYYQGKNKGIAIETTVRDFLNSIGEYRIKDNYGIETINVAFIKYIDYLKDSMNDKFGFLTPFLYKRKNYEYEQELRFIISLRMAVEFCVDIPKEGIFVPFNYSTGFKRIILSPDSDSEYEARVNEIMNKYNVNIPVSQSELNRTPKY